MSKDVKCIDFAHDGMNKAFSSGNMSNYDFKNYIAQRHGFKDHAELRSKIRSAVFAMIHLKQDHQSINAASKYTILKLLHKELFEIIPCCACCGETHLEFLTVDHMNNNGAEHRKSGRFRDLQLELLRNGFKASDYQILCMNCNFALGHSGYCPHKPEIKRVVRIDKCIVKDTQNEKSLFDF